MALLRRAFRRPGSYRQKETRFRGKESKIRRQHADDLSRHGVHPDVPAEDVWIGIKTLPPVGVGHDGHSVVLGHRGFLFTEGATHREIDAEGREKIRRDAHDFCLLSRTGFADDFAEVTKDGNARERRNVAAPLVVIGYRRAGILESSVRIGVEDRHQPIGLRKGKRTEQNGIDHREDREVRAETNRDRGERRDREGWSFAKLAKSELEIVHVIPSATLGWDRPAWPGAPATDMLPVRSRRERWSLRRAMLDCAPKLQKAATQSIAQARTRRQCRWRVRSQPVSCLD